MSKRDLISEIEAKKLRFPAYYPASFRLFYLQNSFTEYKKTSPQPGPIPSLFVIGLAACLEVATRDAIRKLEAKLLELFAQQETILTGADEASEITAFKAAQEAFEKHVDAEVAFELARVGMSSGNGMRMLEAQTLKEFCDFRIKRLHQAIDWIESSWEIE